jgi:MoaA/NifB/PqqE/SkfB family radical SAM enzyme
MINFVMMVMNFHQIEDIVRLSARLGVDQVNFKQCDVIRGENGRDYGLFAPQKNREVRRLEKAVSKARRLAKKLRIKTTAFAFTPDELPVCDQDPRGSLFVRHDGYVAPCINLAFGGHTTFLGEKASIATVHYGRLPDQDLLALWDNISCKFYRERFSHRVRAHDAVIVNSSFEASLPKLRETLQAAKDAMPEAPPGCNVCHYLYGI